MLHDLRRNRHKAHVIWFDGDMPNEDRALPQGTVTFLLTDVENSSVGWDTAPRAMADAITQHYEVFDRVIRDHRGLRPQEQGEGDSIVAVFSSAGDAAAAAVAAQLTLAETKWPDGAAVSVRMGLHTGEANLRDAANYFGETIVRTARIRNLAFGGQILLSGAAAAVIRPALPADSELIDRGVHPLTGLTAPEHVWELTRPGHPEFGGIRTPSNIVCSAPLPNPVTPFVGRSGEVESLVEAVRRDRLVTLNGVGGCGKTRLAIEAARAASDFFDDAYFIELATITDDDAVEGSIAVQLGIGIGNAEPLEVIVRAFADQRVLLVLDNCEQVLAAAAAATGWLLSRVPSLTVVATSREPLGVSGETSWRVSSLATDDAVELFIDRAIRARARNAGDQRALVEHICARLDGIPLAIELAAARAGSLPLARLANGLDDRFRLLTGGARGAVPRQQTLQASVDWSFSLLTDTEQLVFRRLAVFSGGFTLDAAEAVLPDDALPLSDVLPAVMALVDKSLIAFGDSDRYHLLETLRHYAGEKLIASGEMPAVRDRHLQWALSYLPPYQLYQGEPNFRDPTQALEELPNLTVAAEWATHSADAAHLFAAMIRLGIRSADGPALQRALARLRAIDIDALPPDLACASLAAIGFALIELGGFRAARDYLDRLERAIPEATDPLTRAAAFEALIFGRGHMDAVDEGVRLARAHGSPARQAFLLSMKAVVVLFNGDRVGTACLMDEVDELERVHGLDSRGFHSGNRYMTRANLALAHGDTQTLRRYHRAGPPPTEWYTNPRARFFRQTQDVVLSLYLGATSGREGAVIQDLQDARAAGFVLADERAWALGAWEMVTGDAIAGAESIVAAYEGGGKHFTFTNLGVDVMIGMPVAHAYLTLDDVRGAEEALQRIRRLAARMHNSDPVLLASTAALVAMHSGDTEAAQRLARDALAPLVQAGLLPNLARCFELLAVAASRLGADIEASRLIGCAQRVRDNTEFRLVWPDERVLIDSISIDETAYAEGLSLSTGDAVAYALRAHTDRKRPSFGVAALTPTEAQVAQLAAEGMTNKDIGVKLLMGTETVKTHLSRVYAKLSVRGRAELSAAIARPMKI